MAKQTKAAARKTAAKAAQAKQAAADVAKAKQAARKAKAAAKAQPAPVQADKLGSRVGSNLAKVNAALGKKPKTMQQLMEAAGLAQTYYNHLNRLVEAGLVVKTDAGYALAPKAK